MFYCNDCDNTFDEPKIIKEQQGYYHGAPAYEEWAVCPYCESTDYEEVRDDDDDF